MGSPTLGPSSPLSPDLRCLLKTKSLREPTERSSKVCWSGRRPDPRALPLSLCSDGGPDEAGRQTRQQECLGDSSFHCFLPVGACCWKGNSMTQASGFGLLWPLQRACTVPSTGRVTGGDP